MAWDSVQGEHGQIIAHCGGALRTRDELAGLHTPAATRTWKPVAHADLVGELVRSLEIQGIRVGRDAYVTQGDQDAQILGFMDLVVPNMDRPDFGLGLGLSASNDKSRAIRIVAAARVFVCDNRAFSGDANAVFLRAKHTSGLDLARIVPPAVERFIQNADAFTHLIDDMKGHVISDVEAKTLIFDAVNTEQVPGRLLRSVANLYFKDEDQRLKFPDRTLWTLNNAFTQATKALENADTHRGAAARHATENRVGQFFGGVCRRSAKAQILLPAGVVETNASGIRDEGVADLPDVPEVFNADGDEVFVGAPVADAFDPLAFGGDPSFN